MAAQCELTRDGKPCTSLAWAEWKYKDRQGQWVTVRACSHCDRILQMIQAQTEFAVSKTMERTVIGEGNNA